MSEIRLDLDDPAAVAQRLRNLIPINSNDLDPDERPIIEALASQIEAQLPKPPVEEPREWGSVVRARVAPDEEPRLITYVPAPQELGQKPGTQVAWYCDQDCWWHWGELSDVEVLRVGVGGTWLIEVASPPAEAAEADKGPRRAADAPAYCTDASCCHLYEHECDQQACSHKHTEPSPEQVEAEPAEPLASWEMDLLCSCDHANGVCRDYKPDPIEDLIRTLSDRYGSEPVRTNVIRDFRLLAARVLEVGKTA